MDERQDAPGELELVRTFVNTLHDGKRRERLADPAALAGWAVDSGLAQPDLQVTATDLRRAIELREALRVILLSHNSTTPPAPEAAAALDAAARRARVRLRFDGRGDSALEPEAAGIDGALGRLLAIVHASIADGTWIRLKACRDRTCEWAFYDRTRNHSRAWCDMQICGNRAKARAYRRRHA